MQMGPSSSAHAKLSAGRRAPSRVEESSLPYPVDASDLLISSMLHGKPKALSSFGVTAPETTRSTYLHQITWPWAVPAVTGMYCTSLSKLSENANAIRVHCTVSVLKLCA
jgi:hypothetical protein